MSRIKTVEIDGHKYELFFSIYAMRKISDRCGDIGNISEWLDISKASTSEILERVSLIMTDLANGAVIKRNADISMGLESGEQKPLFPDDYFVNCISAADMMKCKNEIFSALNMGAEYEIPEGVTVKEKDPDLAEIEREERKNAKAGKRSAT